MLVDFLTLLPLTCPHPDGAGQYILYEEHNDI